MAWYGEARRSLLVMAAIGTAMLGSGVAEAKPTAQKARAATQGQINVVYNRVRSPLAKDFQTVFQKSRLFETAVAPINQNILLPRDLTVELGECGFVNAFYEPGAHRIVMCYELIDHLTKVFRKSGMGQRDAEVQALNAAVFTFYHELAHMLIHEMDLPIVGKEEDVADQFSALLLSNAGDGGKGAILAAAQWFGSSQSPESREKYMDEHSLNEQRAYYLICLLHAQSPGELSGLVKRLGFPPERLQKCKDEYRQIARSWEMMITPFLRR
ncbi:MAG: hypothetical protein HC860_14350 [Alkalinema sp. RU_4_3]|nr:hypothetical protein [Alkalinema sp. RU_4_3]